MKFDTAIAWLARIYNFFDKINICDNNIVDNLIDENYPHFASKLQSFAVYEKIVFCSTNGKRTMANLFNTILDKWQKTYVTNISQNGKIYPCYTSIIRDLLNSKKDGVSYFKKDFFTMVFTVHELLKYFTSINFNYLVLNNLFIDQKDDLSLSEKRRYIQEAFLLNSEVNMLINVDEPSFYNIDIIKGAYSKSHRNKIFWGFEDIEIYDKSEMIQKNDIAICPNCGCELDYNKRYYSHLGHYNCECGFKRPNPEISASAKVYRDYSFIIVNYQSNKYTFKIPIGGVYNAYNALGAIALSLVLNIDRKTINSAFDNYKPMRARDEILEINNKKIKIKIIKNPTSLSEAIRETYNSKNTKIVFALNNKKNDGLDTSWIWNSNFDIVKTCENKMYACGACCYDIALKLKYSGVNPSLILIDSSYKSALQCCYWELEQNETMLVLTTPSLSNDICNILKTICN